jgi:transcriptional antiterminator NusG
MSDTDIETNESQIDAAEPSDAVTDTPTTEAGDATEATDALAGDATEATDVPAGDATEATDVPAGDATEATDVPAGDATEATDAPAGDATDVEALHEEPVTDQPGIETAGGDDDSASAEAPPEVETTDAPSEAEASDAQSEADEVITDEELLERPLMESPYDRSGRWFVVHTQSGYEKKVKQNLEARIVSMNAEDAIYEVVIPMEDYVDFRNGKRIVAQRKMFPGYLLVRAELDDQSWFVIRNTPGVTGFVGQGAKPSPLPRRDVESFLMPKGGTEEQVAQRAKPRLEYEIGETVRVREGPFADFSGEVIELNEDQLKLKVLVNIFGRETPVELEFSKVAKL